MSPWRESAASSPLDSLLTISGRRPIPRFETKCGIDHRIEYMATAWKNGIAT
jgi:hypothetical protein